MSKSEDSIRRTGERDDLYHLNEKSLAQLAYRALQTGMTSRDFVTVCIDVDDPSWSEVVDYLMPNADWNQFRARGEKPVARGTVRSEILDYLSEVVPDIASTLKGDLPVGTVRVVVMGSGGASVYNLNPAATLNLN